MKKGRMSFVALVAALAILAGAGPALAAMSNTLGAGAKATGYGGAFTAIADDFSATFYNPAGLATVKHRELVSGWLFSRPNVTMGAENAYDELTSGPVLGNVFPFEILGIKASFGIYNFWPRHGARVLHIQSSPLEFSGGSQGNSGGPISPGVNLRIPRRLPESIYLSNEQQQHLDFVTGLGLKLHDKFYFGAGLRANVKLLGDVDVDFIQTSKGAGVLAPTPPGASQITGQITARPTFGWILGGLIDVGNGLKIGGTWKQETSSIFRQGLNAHTTLPTTDELAVVIPVKGQINLDTFFEPQEATLGLAWDINERWTVSADFTWQDWSRYGGNELRASFETIPSFEVPPNQGQSGTGTINFIPQPKVHTHDIFIPRFGIQYQVKRVWRFRAGWARIPSVVGDSRGGAGVPIRDVNKNIIGYATTESNLADSDKQVFSIGMGLEQDDPFEWFELPQTIDVTYQFVHLQGRTFKTLDTNNPFGNFHYSGDQWSLILTNTARF
jgi:long-subunit fatty acid transport protein